MVHPYITTSAKIIQLNEWGCRDGMDHAKNHGNKVIPLAILSRTVSSKSLPVSPVCLLSVVVLFFVIVFVFSFVFFVLVFLNNCMSLH